MIVIMYFGQASIYSPLLYDAFYNYGLALSDTINQSNGKILPEVYRNGSLLAKNGKRTFLGKPEDNYILHKMI